MKTATLLTDFGDFYAAQVKGVLAGSDINVVDITHRIRPHRNSVQVAAYALLHVYDSFPKGTVHIAVVDPGVGSQRAALALRTKNYWFIGPDNGLLAPAADEDGVKEAFIISIEPKSRTFHGRDVFAPAAVQILAGSRKALKKTKSYLPLDLSSRAFVNKFGNIELPFSEEIMTVNGRGVKNYATYSDASSGELFSVIDSRGLREIAINRGNAVRKLGRKLVVKTRQSTYNLEVLNLGI